MEKLTEFLANQPTPIEYIAPSSPNYAEIRSGYLNDPSLNPPLIVRPQSTEEVALITSFVVQHGIRFTVRAGGHDLFGRSFKPDAVALDLRKLNQVQVDQQSRTARIGGGTLTSDLARALGDHGLVAASPTVPSVGYLGWAMHGGYGPYLGHFGLGADQILAAKVIDHQGKVVEADAELLKGIRGAGAAFGIVVEATIRVFPLDKVLAGVIMFAPGDLSAILRQFNDWYRKVSAELPAALGIQQGVTNSPAGPLLGLFFTWSSNDVAEGEKWLAKISTLAPVATNSVQWISPLAWLETIGAFLPKTATGSFWSISLKELTSEAVEVIGAYTSKIIADPQVMMGIHEFRGPSATPKDNSVFSARTPHYMVEIICTPVASENLEAALAWGREFRDALARTNAENVLPERYIALTGPDEVDMAKMYGEHWPFLQQLKKERDPLNVFRTALAQF